MSEPPSAGTRPAERNKGGRSAGAGESYRQRTEFKKGNLAVDLALSYSWLVVLMITGMSAKERMGVDGSSRC
jgi:hypothetical protein